MTTISNLNIVVQQGDIAREATQSTKSQPMDPRQLTAAQQQEKDQAALSSVPESEQSDAVTPDKEQREKKKREKEEAEKNPDSPGRLLDTIA
ncbi:MAG: hypothetical protein ABIK15_11225 [Pseudomonadota bacterium]